MGGAAAQVAEGDAGMASVLLRGLAQRTAARELLRAQEYEEDREWTRQGDTYYARFQEGYLCKLMSSGLWILVLVWPDQSTRVLIRGRRKVIERYAQEVLCYGPPGGPDYQGGELDWRVSDEDTTLRAATIGGELRLMPWQGEQHLLVLVQNDYGVAILGRGLREVLLRTAEELLDERSADTLHLRLGDARINLHGLGSASIVGYVDLQRGGQFVLGPVGNGDFGLFYKLGVHTRTVGVYTLAEVLRGDLGRTFAWCSTPSLVEPSQYTAVGIPQASDVASAAQCEVTPTHVSPEVVHPVPSPEMASAPEVARPMPEVARPRPPPDITRPAGSTITQSLEVGTSRQPSIATPSPSTGIFTTPSPPKAPAGPGAITAPPKASRHLSDQDLGLVERHLTLDEEPTGGGATVVPPVLNGLFRLVELDLGDQLLRAAALRSLLAKRFGIHFDCCARTFRRALLAVAAHTPLLKKVGHRWYLGIGALQRQDSELLQRIRSVTPPDTNDLEDAARETDPEMDRSLTDDRAAPQAPVERRADQESRGPSGPTPVTDQDRRLQAPVERAADPEAFPPQASADQTADARRTDHERVPGPGSAGRIDNLSIHPRKEDVEPDRRAYAAAADPAPSEETPAPPRLGYQRRLRTDGKPTVWQRRWEPLPAEQSASRFPGKKGRGS